MPRNAENAVIAENAGNERWKTANGRTGEWATPAMKWLNRIAQGRKLSALGYVLCRFAFGDLLPNQPALVIFPSLTNH